MSSPEDHNKDHQAAPEASAPVAESSVSEAPPSQSGTPPPVVERRAGGVVAGLALVVALAALGLSGWLAYQDYLQPAEAPASDPDPAIAEHAAALEALEARLAALNAELAALDSRQQTDSDQLGRLVARSDARESQLAGLEQGLGRVDERTTSMIRQIEQLEQVQAERTGTVADLQRRLEAAIEQLDARGDLQREIDRDLRRQMLMLEAAGLLRVGQDFAELQGQIGQARQAFERARSRLAAIDDPRLEQVRRTLAGEIEALAGHAALDVDSEAARLQRLAQESREWPLQLPGSAPPADQAEQPEGWRGRLGQTFGALVRVERRDELGRDAGQFEAAREALGLRLLAAELALLRRDGEELARQTSAAIGLLDAWFDGEAEVVKSARAALERLAGLDLTPDPPELGAALEALLARLETS